MPCYDVLTGRGVLIFALAALIPPPRWHRHRYIGVLAPNSSLRAAVTPLAQPADDVDIAASVADDPVVCGEPSRPAETTTGEPLHRKAARDVWALLLARIYEGLPLLCPMCGDEMRIIAFITEGPAIREILDPLGEPSSPPRQAPARGPPLWASPGGETGDIDRRRTAHRTSSSISASLGRRPRSAVWRNACLWSGERQSELRERLKL